MQVRKLEKTIRQEVCHRSQSGRRKERDLDSTDLTQQDSKFIRDLGRNTIKDSQVKEVQEKLA